MKTKGMFIVLLILLLNFIIVNAAVVFDEDFEVNLDVSTNKVFISGKISSAGGETINLLVLRPGVSLDTLDATNYKQDIKDIRSTYSLPDGSFTFEIQMDDIYDMLGDYTVIVKNQYAQNSLIGIFYFADANAKQRALDAINNANDEKSLADAFSMYYREFGLPKEDYSNLKEWSLVYNYIINSNKTFQNIPGFLVTYNEAMALHSISRANVDNIHNILSKYSNVLRIDIAEQSDYMKLNNKGKSFLASYLLKSNHIPYTKIDDFVTSFQNGVVLGRLSSAENWMEMKENLQKYKDYTGIDITSSAFVNLGDYQIALLKDMLDIEYNSYDEVSVRFNSLISVYTVKKNSKTNSSGGSGGTGGSRKSYSLPQVAFPIVEIPIVEIPIAEIPVFKDLTGYEWAVNAIQYLSDLGVLVGKTNELFAPGDYITRAEYVKLLVLSFDMFDRNAECNFQDVSKNDWYYPYIASANNAGIVNGISKELFAPNEKITREQMVVMLERVMELKNISIPIQNPNVTFNDESVISDYALKSVKKLSEMGIINGMSGNFMPQAFSTRAEAATVIFRTLKR